MGVCGYVYEWVCVCEYVRKDTWIGVNRGGHGVRDCGFSE